MAYDVIAPDPKLGYDVIEPETPPYKTNVGGAIEHGLGESIPFEGSKLNPLTWTEVVNRWLTSGTPPADVKGKDRLTWTKPKEEPPEPVNMPEKIISGASTAIPSIVQAGIGMGAGTKAAEVLKASKGVTGALQLAGSSVPSVVNAGSRGGPKAAAGQGLVDMLMGGAGVVGTKAIGAVAPIVTRPLKSGLMGLLEKGVEKLGIAGKGPIPSQAKMHASSLKAALDNTSEGRALVKAVGEDEALKLMRATDVQPVKGKIGSEGINKAFDVGDVPTMKIYAKGGPGIEPDMTGIPDITSSPTVHLQNLIREADAIATAHPGTTVGSMGKLKTATEEADKVLDAVGKKGFQYQDVHDMRRAYQTLAFNEKDPTIKTFYQAMADGIGERAAVSTKSLGISPSQMEETFGRAIKAEPKYLSQVAQNKAREEALKKKLTNYAIRVGVPLAGIGAAGYGLSPIIEHMTAGNK
jgi:hypothetical protein